jgi:GNAT superfamily N-acetyltransferase
MNDAIAFRDATPADLPAIVAMLADDQLGARREDASLPLDPGYLAAFASITTSPNDRLIVAVETQEAVEDIVGTMQLSFLPGLSSKGAWRGQIEAVRIRADRRGTGLGAVMMAWVVEQYRARGCKSIQLTTNKSRKDAHRFYERLGFLPSHEGYKRVL